MLIIPVELHLAHAFTDSIVWIVSGLFMLRGKNWARVLALFWGLGVLVLTLLVTQLSLPFYLKLATWLLMLYLLTRESVARSIFVAHRKPVTPDLPPKPATCKSCCLQRAGLSAFMKGSLMGGLQAIASGCGARAGPVWRCEVGVAAHRDFHAIYCIDGFTQKTPQLVCL